MSFSARFKPSHTKLEINPKETVLAAALRQSYHINWGCDAGSCQVCNATLLSGKVLLTTGEELSTSGEEDDSHNNQVLLCQAQLLEDSEFQFDKIWPPGEFPVHELMCQVVSVTPHPDANHQSTVTLRLPAGHKVERRAGQWLKIQGEGFPREKSFMIEEFRGEEKASGDADQEEGFSRLVSFTYRKTDELLTEILESGLIKISLPHLRK